MEMVDGLAGRHTLVEADIESVRRHADWASAADSPLAPEPRPRSRCVRARRRSLDLLPAGRMGGGCVEGIGRVWIYQGEAKVGHGAIPPPSAKIVAGVRPTCHQARIQTAGSSSKVNSGSDDSPSPTARPCLRPNTSFKPL